MLRYCNGLWSPTEKLHWRTSSRLLHSLHSNWKPLKTFMVLLNDACVINLQVLLMFNFQFSYGETRWHIVTNLGRNDSWNFFEIISRSRADRLRQIYPCKFSHLKRVHASLAELACKFDFWEHVHFSSFKGGSRIMLNTIKARQRTSCSLCPDCHVT